MTNYSNPRMSADIEGWPMGRHKTATAHFHIEQTKNGERACRQTVGATKKLTYARKMRIVDGDDGRTYIAALTEHGGVTIWQGNMLGTAEHASGGTLRHADLLGLFT
jgi:hypothetical protein